MSFDDSRSDDARQVEIRIEDAQAEAQGILFPEFAVVLDAGPKVTLVIFQDLTVVADVASDVRCQMQGTAILVTSPPLPAGRILSLTTSLVLSDPSHREIASARVGFRFGGSDNLRPIRFQHVYRLAAGAPPGTPVASARIFDQTAPGT